MIWVRSACPVGIRVAARLADLTGVRLSAPRSRTAEARAVVASLLGRDPGVRLEVQPDDLLPSGADAASGRIRELWHLTYAPPGKDAGDDLAGRARDAGIAYRRFELDPVAAGPEAPAPDTLSLLLRALDETLQEVRAREPDYFERRALRTTFPENVLFLTAGSAAAAILGASGDPPGPRRIAARADGGPTRLAELIGDAYDVELIFGAEPSELTTVDRLFEARISDASWGAPVTARRDPGATDAEAVRFAGAAGAAELAEIVTAWRRRQLAAREAERGRLAALREAPVRRPASRGGPGFQVFGEAGPTVVIVNAIAQDLSYWVRLIDRLSRGHRVVTWPPRSVREDGQATTFDDQARDLEAVVGEAAAEGPIHLVGWCTGPKLCARYCLAHPERVASMVFLAGTYRPFGDSSLDTPYEITLEMVFKLLDRSPGAASTVRATLLEAVKAAKQKAAGARDFGAEVLGRIDPDLLPSVVAPYATDASTLLYASQIRDFWGRSIEADVAAIHAPVLVVGAELDRIASPWLGQRVARALPRARFLELPGATHYCMYDRPDEVAAVIARFIEAQESNHDRT